MAFRLKSKWLEWSDPNWAARLIHGEHLFFEEEQTRIRDCREAPIKFASYSISFRGGHVQVRIEKEAEKDLKAFFKERALWSEETLARHFSQLPFEPYAPVRRQFLIMLNQVNRLRKTAGLERIETSCLRLSRKPCRPFSAPGKLPLM